MAEEKTNEPVTIGKFGIGLISSLATGVLAWALLGAIKSPGVIAESAQGTAASVRDRANRIEADITRIEGEISGLRRRVEDDAKTVQRFREALSYGRRYSREDHEDFEKTYALQTDNLQRQLDQAQRERERVESRLDGVITFLSRPEQGID